LRQTVRSWRSLRCGNGVVQRRRRIGGEAQASGRCGVPYGRPGAHERNTDLGGRHPAHRGGTARPGTQRSASRRRDGLPGGSGAAAAGGQVGSASPWSRTSRPAWVRTAVH
jgi:hypothetical protein